MGGGGEGVFHKMGNFRFYFSGLNRTFRLLFLFSFVFFLKEVQGPGTPVLLL